MVSNRVLIGASLAGAAALVGFCIYYDKKRRSDPNYKQKVRERRKRNKIVKQRQQTNEQPADMPPFANPSEAQAFFLQEVQLGEELLSEGDNENAVQHLYNAVQMCGAPSQLMQILHQTLPPTAYAMLMQRLQTARQTSGVTIEEIPNAGGAAALVEEELE